MAGLTPTGFELLTFAEIKAELEADIKNAFGASFDVSPDSPMGQLISIQAERLALLWELGAAIYASQDPDVAEGQSLDALGALTGTLRLEATKSTSDALVLRGTDTTIVSAGVVFSVVGTGARFTLDAPVTISTLAAWVTATPYVVGDLRTNVGNIYVCTTAGTSGAGPTGTGTAIVDGTCVWRYVGAGTAAVLGSVTAEEYGPVIAAAGGLTVIETPVGGLDSVVNYLDAEVGRNLETDPDYRLRREQLLRAQGKGTVEAIRSDILAVDGVSECVVFDNPTNATDVYGIPAHSFFAIVRGGDEQDIREAIWQSKPAGIHSHGLGFGPTFGYVIDSQGFSQPITFGRAFDVDIWVHYEVTAATGAFPVDGEDQIKAALVALGNKSKIGDDVIVSRLACAPFDVLGVLDVTATYADIVPAPVSSANIVIDVGSVAVFDTSRVTVSVTLV